MLTMTCEDGVSVTHTLDGEFAEATRAEKKRWPIYEMAWRSSARPFTTRVMCRLICRRCLCRTVCLTNCVVKRQRCSIRRASMHGSAERAKPVSVPPPVYPETHLSFPANVYNHKARAFYQRYGVQLIDAAYEAHEEKGDVPVMITKHCLRFAFNLCPKQAKGSIKSWKATPMQLIHGDEVLTLKFDCRPCEMHVVGKIKKIIFSKMPHPGSIVASVSPDELMKTLPKRKGA